MLHFSPIGRIHLPPVILPTYIFSLSSRADSLLLPLPIYRFLLLGRTFSHLLSLLLYHFLLPSRASSHLLPLPLYYFLLLGRTHLSLLLLLLSYFDYSSRNNTPTSKKFFSFCHTIPWIIMPTEAIRLTPFFAHNLQRCKQSLLSTE